MNFEQLLQLGMDHLSAHDPAMKSLVARFGMPTFRPHNDYYQELVRSIIGQQLSVRAAAVIFGRFLDLFGHFPAPNEILQKDFEDLKSVGLSRSKTHYIIDFATHVHSGAVDFEHIDSMSNQQIIESLTQIKGIGVWTVHMFLLFAVGRLDVLAVGDLGVRNALSKLYNYDHVVKDVEVHELATLHAWHPYESLVCWYAWQSLNNSPLP